MKRALLLIALIWIAAPPAEAQNYPPTSVKETDCSGTVVTAATAVTPLAAAKAPHGFFLQNLDTTEGLWFSLTGTAVAATPGSFVLGALTATTYSGTNSAFVSVIGFGTGSALSVVAATAGHKFSCMYW